jgi:hypothetical protein
MVVAERMVVLKSGQDRKQYVMNELRKLLGREQYAEYEPLISLAIETIILISHSDLDIKKINPRKCFPCC